MNTMFHTVDIYLGTFLILCGFALSMFNLQRLVKNKRFSAVLISENVFLVCIGVAFISRAVSNVNPLSIDSWETMERHNVDMKSSLTMNCNFYSVFIGYGPLVISMVNSFVSLIIDNYIHYYILKENKEKDDENTVRDVTEQSRTLKEGVWVNIYRFVKNNFNTIAIVTQWIVPLLLALLMYPMGVKETEISMTELRSLDNTCMSIMKVKMNNCTNPLILDYNSTSAVRRDGPVKYLEAIDSYTNGLDTEFNVVIDKVREIVANYKYDSKLNYSLPSPFRRSKFSEQCMNVCYIENKSMLVYMFFLAIASYFTPITISTIILTKIHLMKVKKSVVKEYVSREMLYNVLFWTPIMFDTFLSIILCSYESKGTRTTIFNVIANVYQVVKNFMNTKYFSNNAVLPV